MIVLLSGGKRKLGYDSLQELSGLFYNEKIPEEMGKHAVDRYLDFVRYLAGRAGGGAKGVAAALSAAPPEFTIAIGEEEQRTWRPFWTDMRGFWELQRERRSNG